ncbi:MAG: spermidine/putrescine ABC transporter substrate-binding protein [Patulibacter sp.]
MTAHRYHPNRAAERLKTLAEGGAVSRAGFMAGAGLGVSAFLAACGSSGSSTGSGSAGGSSTSVADLVGPTTPTFAQGGELNIYSWPDYFGEKDLAAWKSKTGTKVNISTYESNEDMFAKMNTAARSSYDLVVPTSQYVATMAELKQIQRLDKSKIPWQYLDPELLGKEFDPGNDYSVPKSFGTTGFLYDPTVTGRDFTTRKEVLEFVQQPEFSGKLNLPDGGKALVEWGMGYYGYDRNSTNLAEWQKAADYLISDVVPHVNAFGGTFDFDPVVSGKIWGMTTDSSVARRALIAHPKLKYVLLKPQTELWVDNFVIVNGTPNLAQAYSFLSYFLNRETMLRETEQIGYATAVKDAKANLPASFKRPEVVFPSQAEYAHLVPTKLDPKIQGDIDKLGNKIKAAAA